VAAQERGITSVIIVNFNAGAYLAAAVKSVLDQEVPVEIIVVDNMSTDSSLQMLQESVSDSRLSIVPQKRNFGFAHACNVGLAKAQGTTFLLLNPDCRIAPGALLRLLEVLHSDDTIGMVGPLLVNPDGTEQRGGRREIPNPWQIFCMTLQFHRMMPNHPRFRSINMHSLPLPEKPQHVQAISGACMLVKRSVVRYVGTLDTDYFMHFEDLDWCLRFTQANYGIVFVPDAVVEHTQGVCSQGRIRRVAYHKHRSMLIFLNKHFTQFYPTLFMALVSCAVTFRFLLVALRSLFVRQPVLRDPWEQVAGAGHFRRNSPDPESRKPIP
jgi:GT2 family glycosyltransferase